MEQNIYEICSINFHANIASVKCSNKSHLYGGYFYHKSIVPCYNCKNIVCPMCCNQKRNKCVACHKMTFGKIPLKNKCDSCKNHKRYYMCGMCSNIIERCTGGCKNNNEITWGHNNKYILCKTCEQK